MKFMKLALVFVWISIIFAVGIFGKILGKK